ncbi:MAG: 30S ribosomal protein S9 [Candidatus Woykebacteria bacterium RBG_13_40_7b]|uniref:30S ribosomal protein S9 n=1 Tax=Candidatus Woykebacteria bacterium RBG_13_40_7b TaxID=1802594 RepID=A0A1G1W7W7_9BACT|nr:MAG: 30S ribosomal protein S9 [Candidatus Woykebacteria bacterium RBG_13_40_7b]
MPRTKKEEVSKKEKPAKIKKETKVKVTEFFESVGRRKESSARVRLWKEKSGKIVVNDLLIENYFYGEVFKKIYLEPFRVVNRIDQFGASVKVEGGGKMGQIEAIVLGISRSLAKSDESFERILKKYKLLTRDSREKERRKYGLAGKARKKKQSPKR